MAKHKGKKSPQQIVEREFSKINRTYFDDAIIAEIALEVPPKNVAVSIQNPSRQVEPGSPVERQIAKGLQFALDGDLDKAISQLQPLAERRYKPAVEGLIQIERSRHGDYLRWARVLNNMDKSIRKFPAACVDREIGKIYIHPMVGESPCPRYVMAYLIHHECLHMVIDTPDDDPHSEEFMEQERKFPRREEARRWLRHNNFPVVDA